MLGGSPNQVVDRRICSGARPIRWWTGEYAQGLDQSGGGLGEYAQGLDQSGGGLGEYAQGLDQSGGGQENMLRGLTNQVVDRKTCSGA
jgi:hypothetical protein